ncbi:MAG: hypothetical protein ACRC68_03960 [Clostridium sp.]
MANIKSKKDKVKNKTNISEIIGGYKFEYLKFNLSFFSTNNDYNFKQMDKTTKADILDRLQELSTETFMQVASYSKNRGFELIDKKSIAIKANYKQVEFEKDGFRNSGTKYHIFRLYPNNNPLPVRLIGKITSNIFYILFIDMDHKTYK